MRRGGGAHLPGAGGDVSEAAGTGGAVAAAGRPGAAPQQAEAGGGSPGRQQPGRGEEGGGAGGQEPRGEQRPEAADAAAHGAPAGQGARTPRRPRARHRHRHRQHRRRRSAAAQPPRRGAAAGAGRGAGSAARAPCAPSARRSPPPERGAAEAGRGCDTRGGRGGEGESRGGSGAPSPARTFGGVTAFVAGARGSPRAERLRRVAVCGVSSGIFSAESAAAPGLHLPGGGGGPCSVTPHSSSAGTPRASGRDSGTPARGAHPERGPDVPSAGPGAGAGMELPLHRVGFPTERETQNDRRELGL